MSAAIGEYSKTEAALAALRESYKGVIYDVATAEGMTAARKGRAELRRWRVDLEEERVRIKAPALQRCRDIDSEAKRITAELSALEDPIDAQIKAEERRAEEVRTFAARAEQARLDAEAAATKRAEEERMAAERAEIARRQVELAAAERAAREKIEAEAAASRKRIEEEERAARYQREQADERARQARLAEQARLETERQRLAAEREAIEAPARKAREEAERKEREARQAQAELADARGMLLMFCGRYAHLEEFAPVVEAIREYLNRTEVAKKLLDDDAA